MNATPPIYILGSGAVGFPLAVFLANAGRPVMAVRTSGRDLPRGALTVSVSNGDERSRAAVETIALNDLTHVDGMLVVTAKAHANVAIVQALREKAATGPIVVLQNGLGVEQPFLDAGFSPVYRCILYVTAQPAAENEFLFRPVAASPIGSITGDDAGLEQCVAALSTAGFPFRAEANIQREIWKKAIVNVVFNSICPLLDVDNGIFVRDAAAARLARELVRECVLLTDRLDLGLGEHELVEQILAISKRSDGQLISTLQDIRGGRQTEIAFLNLEIARVAAAQQPSLELPKVELLGNMILAKSAAWSAKTL